MLRVVLSQHALDLRFIVDAVVNDPSRHHFAPTGDKFQSLLPDLLYLQQVEIILGNDKAEVHQVAEAFRDARFVDILNTDPVLRLLELPEVAADLLEMGQEELGVVERVHEFFALVLDTITDTEQLLDLKLVLSALLQILPFTLREFDSLGHYITTLHFCCFLL